MTVIIISLNVIYDCLQRGAWLFFDNFSLDKRRPIKYYVTILQVKKEHLIGQAHYQWRKKT